VGNIVSSASNRWPDGNIFFEFDAGFDRYRPSFDISGSVGAGGTNKADDVKFIQTRLNRFPASDGGPAPPLVVDGLIGPKTLAAIRQFQAAHFGWQDGRVDPGGPTLVELTIDDVDTTSTEAKGIILNAVHEWNKQLGRRPRWVRRRQQDGNYVVFQDGNFNESDSLGMRGGKQAITISLSKAQQLMKTFGGTAKGVVIHEMGHVAGLRHEHQRSDRDSFVTIHWDKVSPSRRCGFVISPVDPNCKSVPPCVSDGPYDFASTMHYFPTQAAEPPGATTITSNVGPQRMGSFNGLSAGDRMTLLKFYR
jgi:peptidoglycan hydrolase-like protein with peptidoglycan-binding domain